jgi:aerotaxis receptor
MRNCGPVTQSEYTFPPEATLVSVTDPKGRITYGNDAFVAVSGYSREELLGQPHNMVRHPDMPEEAFRDMWATIESGLPWTGLVKNRRKDGDHYWVQANATPMRDGSRIVGYLSVRTAPSRQQVQAAEILYAQMRSEAQQGLVRTGLSGGFVQRRDLWGRVVVAAGRAARGIGWSGALVGAGAALAAIVAPLGWAAWVPVVLLTMGGTAWFGHLQESGQRERLTQQVLRLAAGDLCAPPLDLKSGPWMNLERGLNQLGVNLRAVVLDCRNEVENLRGAVGEIAAGNQDLSARTESQASSLEETAATMDEINGTVQQSAQSAAQGAHLAEEASSLAQNTSVCVRDVGSAMGQIQDSSNRIADFIQVIEGVAFQTNILALNAAVEAARAGDSGRGFAVVAAEVRVLAQRTSEAAKEVRKLIAEASERVAAGYTQTQAAQSRMDEALASVGRVSQVLREISHASAEQQTGIAQINEAVTHIDGLTQQNAAMVEELASSAMSVTDQVAAVAASLSLFRLRAGDRSVAEVDAVELRKQGRAA